MTIFRNEQTLCIMFVCLCVCVRVSLRVCARVLRLSRIPSLLLKKIEYSDEWMICTPKHVTGIKSWHHAA